MKGDLPIYLLVLLSFLPGNLFSEQDPSLPGPFKVSIIEFADLIDPNQNGRKVPIKVHYPEETGTYPVIIYSHGGGGNWDANYAQANHLATHGFVVLCPEHVGSNTDDLFSGLRIMKNLESMTRDAIEVLARPKDISFAINRAEEWNKSHFQLRGRMDLSKVGVAGHSFGAFTALVVCGARVALDWLVPKVPPGHGLGPDLTDKRVRSCVALSPQGPGEPFFHESSYATINRPILGITGSKDIQQKSTAENRRRFFNLLPPKDKIFIWLINADHLAFSDSTGSKRRALRSTTREFVQPLVRAATLLFFRATLLGDKEGEKVLSREYLKRFIKGSVNDLEVHTK